MCGRLSWNKGSPSTYWLFTRMLDHTALKLVNFNVGRSHWAMQSQQVKWCLAFMSPVTCVKGNSGKQDVDTAMQRAYHSWHAVPWPVSIMWANREQACVVPLLHDNISQLQIKRVAKEVVQAKLYWGEALNAQYVIQRWTCWGIYMLNSLGLEATDAHHVMQNCIY